MTLPVYPAHFARVHKQLERELAVSHRLLECGGDINAMTQHIRGVGPKEAIVQDAFHVLPTRRGVEHDENLLFATGCGHLIPNAHLAECRSHYVNFTSRPKH